MLGTKHERRDQIPPPDTLEPKRPDPVSALFLGSVAASVLIDQVRGHRVGLGCICRQRTRERVPTCLPLPSRRQSRSRWVRSAPASCSRRSERSDRPPRGQRSARRGPGQADQPPPVGAGAPLARLVLSDPQRRLKQQPKRIRTGTRSVCEFKQQPSPLVKQHDADCDHRRHELSL